MAAQFDSKYLAMLDKARKLLNERATVSISHNGPEGAALVHIGYEFLGVMMPANLAAPGEAPDWAHEELTEEQAA